MGKVIRITDGRRGLRLALPKRQFALTAAADGPIRPPKSLGVLMKASSLFLRTGVLAALAGMGLGITMGITEDHTLQSLHAHINLVGWASMFLFGLYYRATPAADGRLALWHYCIAAPAFIVFMVGICGIFLGHMAFVPLAIVGSLLTILSMAMFAWIVFATTAPARTGEARVRPAHT